MADWLVIGPVKNWQLAVEHKVWAVSPAQEKSWRSLSPGDRVFFYATAPVKGVVGWGSVASTAVVEEPFWPEEKAKGHVLWPYRIRFQDIHVLPAADWQDRALRIERQGIVFQRALQPVASDRAETWRERLGLA
ncbi:MAG TPA: EVE domain-containing protein [Acidobacteriota bacterium]|jgi:hypothetical protein|nr:EVE domain-containing protein [Acidobacteriota bacterium]HRV08566.1 EVE domain-containing protein [Acidobacteriota bacterium]